MGRLLRGAPSLSLCGQPGRVLCLGWGPCGFPDACSSGFGSDAKWDCYAPPWAFLGRCSCEAVLSCWEPLGPQLRARAALAQPRPAALVTDLLQRDRLSPISQLGSSAKGGFQNPPSVPQEDGCCSPASQLPVSPPRGMGTGHSLLLHGCQWVQFFLLTQPLPCHAVTLAFSRL